MSIFDILSFLYSNYSGILTPMDEFQYWLELSESARKDDVKGRAEHFQELFQPISREYCSLESMSLMEILELVELTQDTLDEVWKQIEYEPLYPEKRMRHLLDITGMLAINLSDMSGCWNRLNRLTFMFFKGFFL